MMKRFEPGPVETHSRTGRHRPEGFRAPRQEPERREAAQRRLTEGANKLVECSRCEQLVKNLHDHVCVEELVGEPPDLESTPIASGSATFYIAQDNRGVTALRRQGRS